MIDFERRGFFLFTLRNILASIFISRYSKDRDKSKERPFYAGNMQNTAQDYMEK